MSASMGFNTNGGAAANGSNASNAAAVNGSNVGASSTAAINGSNANLANGNGNGNAVGGVGAPIQVAPPSLPSKRQTDRGIERWTTHTYR